MMLSGRSPNNRINIFIPPNGKTNNAINKVNSVHEDLAWTLDNSNNCYYNNKWNIYVYYNLIEPSLYIEDEYIYGTTNYETNLDNYISLYKEDNYIYGTTNYMVNLDNYISLYKEENYIYGIATYYNVNNVT
jgi:hypothetical protein